MPKEPDLETKLLILRRTLQNVQEEVMITGAVIRAIAKKHDINVTHVENQALCEIHAARNAAEERALRNMLFESAKKPGGLADVVQFPGKPTLGTICSVPFTEPSEPGSSHPSSGKDKDS
jgi:hypothetical protein